jgi:hypothetical protein
MGMIRNESKREAAYRFILKTLNRRLEQTIPDIEEGDFEHLSLAGVLNMLFLLRGDWGSVGDFVGTLKALRAILGDDLVWSEPALKTSSDESADLVN